MCLSHVTTSLPSLALFLLDNRFEVYLWQSSTAEDQADRWHAERKCALETTLQYCKGKLLRHHAKVVEEAPNLSLSLFLLKCFLIEVNPRRPPHAYLILEGSEPLTFTNVFPRWERKQAALAQVRRTALMATLSCKHADQMCAPRWSQTFIELHGAT